MKRRFIVPAFFVVDIDNMLELYPSERELYDAVVRKVDAMVSDAQKAANDKLNSIDAALLLDESPQLSLIIPQSSHTH